MAYQNYQTDTYPELDQEHQEIIQGGYSMGDMRTMSTITSQHPTIVHEQLENEKVLQAIEMQLRGMVKDFRNGQIVNTGYPLIPKDEGVYALLHICRSHLDKNISLSNVDDKEIYTHMKILGEEVDLWLMGAYHKYDIKKENLPIITNVICTPIFFNFKRARDGFQAKGIQQQNEVRTVVNPGQSQGGWFKRAMGKINI